jgi:peroxiredoxin
VNARQQQLAARVVSLPAAEQMPALQAAREQQFAALEAERRHIMTQFVRANPGSQISLRALAHVAGFGRDLDPAAMGPLFEGLAPAVRQSPDGQAFAARLAEARRLGVGQLAPDFTQNDPSGRSVSLRDFRGQYVLLDFWASWCKPCRAENPALVAAYQQFKSRHFTVLSVSLDQDKDKWEKAIAADGLNWTHVSDLKLEQNEVARRYGIEGVPQNLLIGPDGRILALNLHGAALRQKLAAVLPAAAP